jgi:HD-GYP domain-containing protein (c-di-GMP phosphodiesterase class II)
MAKRKREVERLKEIIRLESEFNKIQDMDLLLERVLLEARRVTSADAGSIYLVEGEHLRPAYSQNDTTQRLLPPGQKLPYTAFTVPINKKSQSGYVAATGQVLRIADVYDIPPDSPVGYDTSYDKTSGYRTTSVLTLPLQTNTGEILGVLQVINALDPEGGVVPFSADDELTVMHFANNATVALQRAQLTRSILLRMISMAELRDPAETGPHVNRVAGYAVEIYEHHSRQRSVPEPVIAKSMDILRMAAMLHDVGKVGISDLILKKPAAFTPEERTVMQTHTFLGAQLFAHRMSEFDEIAAQVALTHHERWDGMGYPGPLDLKTGQPAQSAAGRATPGLKGDEISLFGRVVAVADVYDALSCRRVYKQAWTEEDVLAELRKSSGSHFDPDVVEAFMAIYPNIKSISAKYPDRH